MPPPPHTPLPQGARLLRAAVLGMCGGLMLGGIRLLVLGVRGVFGTPDCTGLSEPECQLIREAARDLGRLQTLSGGALVALAAALFVLLRPKPPPTPEDPSERMPGGPPPT